MQHPFGSNPRIAAYSQNLLEGKMALPAFQKWKLEIGNASKSINDLLVCDTEVQHLIPVDMSTGSAWLGPASEYENLELTAQKLTTLQDFARAGLIAGGYGEARPFYNTPSFLLPSGAYRNIHLGVDYWTAAGTSIKALWPGTVHSYTDHNIHKDYGPTLILEHQFSDGTKWYSLYGHLSRAGMKLWKEGDQVAQEETVGTLGHKHENGNWVPHLHFQIILDLLDHTDNFYGVSSEDLWPVFQQICPDPNLIFRERNIAEI